VHDTAVAFFLCLFQVADYLAEKRARVDIRNHKGE